MATLPPNTMFLTGTIKFPKLAKPESAAQGQPPKYSLTLSLNKNDPVAQASINELNALIEKVAVEKFKENAPLVKHDQMTKNNFIIYKDGATLLQEAQAKLAIAPNSEELKKKVKYAEYDKDSWVMTLSSASRPGYYDMDTSIITDAQKIEETFYAGATCRVMIVVSGFDHVASHNKGITAYLQGVQLIARTAPLGGGMSAEEMQGFFTPVEPTPMEGAV